MKYSDLKIKSYSSRKERDIDNNIFYVLSFSNDKHLKVSNETKKLVEEFNGSNTLDEIIKKVYPNNNHTMIEGEIIEFIEKILIKNNLLENFYCEDQGNKNKRRSNLWKHIPLFDSSRFKFIYRKLEHLFKKNVCVIILLMILVTQALTIKEIMEIGRSSLYKSNSIGVLGLVYLSLLFHEFGHITSAYSYGISVGKIGVGIYLIYPVFYVDMTNVWRLDYKERMITDLSGIYFQLIFTIPIYFLYYITGNHIYTVSIIMITFLSFINLVPILRLDGYWFLTDYLRVSNISVKPLRNLNNLKNSIIYKIKNDKKIKRSTLIYGIYSIVYILSTSIVLIYGVYIVYNILKNYNELFKNIETIRDLLLSGNYSIAFYQLNEIFFSILPFVLICYYFIKISCNFIKSLTNGLLTTIERNRGV